jgi:Fe2+ or Zn2+ uptake regulation protein
MESYEILQNLKASGLRITLIRKQMIELFNTSSLPISAVDIQQSIKANKTTIYREIAVLLESGNLVRVDFGDGIKRYELSHRDHHHHLICVKCKSVTDVHLADDFSKEEKIIAANNKFKVLRHNLEFFGICERCNNL